MSEWDEFAPVQNNSKLLRDTGLDALDQIFGGALSTAGDWAEFEPVQTPQPRLSRAQRRAQLLTEDREAGRNQNLDEDVSLLDNALIGFNKGIEGLKQAGGGLLQAFGARELGQGISDRAQREAEGMDFESSTFGGDFADILGQGAASLIPTIPASLAGGLPAAAIVAGLQGAGGTYDNARRAYKQQGMTDEEANSRAYLPAVLSGLVTGAVTRLFPGGPDDLRQGLATGGLSQVLAKVFRDAGLEATEEGLDQIGQGIIERWTYNPDKSVADIIGDTLTAATVGGVLGGGVRGTVEAIGQTARRAGQPVQEPTPQPDPVQPVQDFSEFEAVDPAQEIEFQELEFDRDILQPPRAPQEGVTIDINEPVGFPRSRLARRRQIEQGQEPVADPLQEEVVQGRPEALNPVWQDTVSSVGALRARFSDEAIRSAANNYATSLGQKPGDGTALALFAKNFLRGEPRAVRAMQDVAPTEPVVATPAAPEPISQPTVVEPVKGGDSNVRIETENQTQDQAQIEGQVTQPEVATPPPTSRRPKEEFGGDLIELMQSVGRISGKKSSKPGTEGYYTEAYNQAIRMNSLKKLFTNKGTGQNPDEVVDSLRRSGALPPDATVDDLWDGLIKAANNRKAVRSGNTRENRLLDKMAESRVKFESLAFQNKRDAVNKKKAQPIPVSDLLAGDELEIGNAKFVVKDFHYDQEDNLTAVEIEDGRKFGVQTVGVDQVIFADPNSYKPAPIEFVPGEDFTDVQRSPKQTPPPRAPAETAPSLTQPAPLLSVEQNARLRELVLKPKLTPTEGTELRSLQEAQGQKFMFEGSFNEGENRAPSQADPLDIQLRAYGKGKAGLKRIINDPRIRIPQRTRFTWNAFLDQPVMNDLNWDALQVKILSAIDGFGGMREGNLLLLLESADPSTLPHEIAHILYEALPQQYRDYIDKLRIEMIRDRYGVGHILESGISSEEFLDLLRDGIVNREDYNLINGSELLATYFGNDFAETAFENRNPTMTKSVWLKIRNWFLGMVDALKRVAGWNPSMDQIVRELLAGQWKPDPSLGADVEKKVREGSFSKDEQAARNAAGVIQTPEQRYAQADYQMAQGVDISRIMTRLGVGTLTGAAQRILKYTDFLGIAQIGTNLNNGNQEGYRQIKARLLRDLLPDEFNHRIKEIARLAAKQYDRVEDFLKKAVADGNEAVKEMTTPKFLSLVKRLEQARVDKETAMRVLEETRLTFATAIKQAQKDLRTEARTDLEIAQLQARLQELDDAAHSSTAMQQLMEDMVRVLDSTPEGRTILEEPGSTRQELINVYSDLKRSTGQTLHNPTLIRWAAYILNKQPKLLSKLYATHLLKTEPGMKRAISEHQAKLIEGLKNAPEKTLKQQFRDREKLVRRERSAKFLYDQLNDDLQEQMEKIGVRLAAADTAAQILSDNEFFELGVETRQDAGYIGLQRPFRPYVDTSITLPSGRAVDTGTARIKGHKDLWEELRTDLESAKKELWDWLNSPQNLDHPNYGVHQMDYHTLEAFYLDQGMNQPNDPIKVWNYTFYIINNGIRIAGGRVAASVKRAANVWDRTRQRAGWWLREQSRNLTAARLQALKARGMKWNEFGYTLEDANEEYDQAIRNELASSYARSTGGLKVGDKLTSGHIVTREDLESLKVEADATSEGFKIREDMAREHSVSEQQVTEDDLGDVRAYRKAQKTSPYMTTREFDWRKLNWAEGVSNARKSFLNALKAEDETTMAQAESQIIKALNDTWDTIGKYLVTQRDPDYSRATIFDGEDGAFKIVGDKIRDNPAAITSFDQLVDELSKYAPEEVDPEQVKRTLLSEFTRIIDAWYQAARPENPDAIGEVKPTVTKNSFSKARGQVLAPSPFYSYGFRDTALAPAGFMHGIHAAAMDRLVSGMQALKNDLLRQQQEFTERAEQIGEGRALDENKLLRQNRKTFDDYSNLKQRIDQLNGLITSMVHTENLDADGNITFARTIGAMTGWLISGIYTTARNFLSGPRYLGWASKRVLGANVMSAPMAAWFLWFEGTAKAAATFIASGSKSALVYAPLDVLAATPLLIRGKVGEFLGKASYRTLHEMGVTMLERLEGVQEMKRRGLMIVEDQAQEAQNAFLGSMLTAGMIVDKTRKLTTGERVAQIPATLMEQVLRLPRTFAPLLGDVTMNSGSVKFTQWMRKQLENELRSAWARHTDWFQSRFNFDNISDPKNILTAKELGLLEQTLASRRDAFNDAGMSFDAEATQFFKDLQANPQAKFLDEAKMTRWMEATINYTNRPSPTNTPLILKERKAIIALISPFMQWKTRMADGFGRLINIYQGSDIEAMSKGDMIKARFKAIAILAMMVLIPILVVGAGVASYEEEAARVMKKALYEQVSSTRQPWDREGLKSQMIGWSISATFGIPFLDMLVNAGMNDLPNRASVDPSLAMVEKAKDTVKYFSGVAQTGDFTYKLPEFMGGMLPDTKVILNRLDSEEGKRSGANAVAVLRRKGPVELLRPVGGDFGVNANELSPFGPMLENAIMKGDMAEFGEVYNAAVATATELGITEPENRINQLVRARSPYSRAFKSKMTEPQLLQFKARLNDGERQVLEDAERKFALAYDEIGSDFTLFKDEETSTPVVSGGGGTTTRSRLGRRSSRSGSSRSRSRRRSGR